MSKITYKELIIEVLKEAKKPLSVSEIWEKACEMGLEKRLSSIGQTSTQTLWNRFFVNRDDFIKATQKPITFWLRSR